jgi:16S rRNA (guanine(1405)-N(7))-methyltransferase
MTNFLNAFFDHFKIDGTAQICDLTQKIPACKADLALVLKTIPCLEQIDREAGRRILAGLQTPNILVSFPAKSLGGRSKGMVQNYERHFNQLVAGQNWKITRFEFPGELAFLIQK